MANDKNSRSVVIIVRGRAWPRLPLRGTFLEEGRDAFRASVQRAFSTMIAAARS